MDLTRFTESVGRLSGHDIRSIAAAIHAQHASAAGDVEWWQATVSIDRLLKQTHHTRAAAMASLAASRAVMGAARAARMQLPDADVVCVARSAAEIARGLAAGPAARPMVDALLETWVPLFVLS
jgi:hypothetical protein